MQVFKKQVRMQILAISLVVFLAAQTAIASDILVAESRDAPLVPASLIQGPRDYIQHVPIVITDSEDFISLGFDGTGTPEDPYLIEGLNVNSTSRCLYLQDISDYVVIRDCFFKESNDYRSCVMLDNTSHTAIQNCIIQGGIACIRVTNSAFITIDSCVIFDGDTGIQVGSSTMLNCSSCRILNNRVGMALWSNACNLTRNEVYRNSEVGIWMDVNSTQNLVTQNKIGRNQADRVENNAHDLGDENNWTGNYWSDYTPPGPYMISGDAESRDNSPRRLEDTEDPVLEPHEDVFYVEGTTGHEIQFNATDEFPWLYVITEGAEVKREGTWISRIISFPIDGLSLGDHVFNIRIYDIEGHETQDSVEVFVFVIIFSDIGTTELVIGSASSVALVFGVIVVFKMRQRRIA